jgi:flagellar biosynthesis/type III secretory pathway chaperone
MSTRYDTGSLQRLADTLWSERHVVEFLLFKLTSAKLLLAADERRFVALALDEVERVVGTLRETELERSIAVEEVARHWRVRADDLTLARLATTAPEPWREVFADHQRAFDELTREVEEAAAANRSLASAGLARIHQTMDMLTGQQEPGTYDAYGRHQAVATGRTRLDAAL